LRDRLIDLPFLVRELLRELSGDPVPSLTDDAMAWLSAQQWPGNVRELRHVLEGAVMRSRSDVIDLAGLRAVQPGDPGGTVSRESDDPRRGVLRDHDGQPLALGVLERQQIIAVLEATEWHQGEAAQQLGVSAKTLYRKIREFGLARPQDVPSRGRRPARGRALPIEGSVT
jgi:DNA-binding NtrC family response regulator